MAPKAMTKVSIPTAYIPKLTELAQAHGLSLDVYLLSVVGGLVTGAGMPGTPTSAPKGAPGRPVIVPEDVPPQAVRDASESGFEGVTRDGKWWKARIGRAAIGGKFSAPEPAAIARFYTHLGFKIGRAQHFGTKGWTIEDAIDQATRMGFAPLASGVSLPTETVDDGVEGAGPGEFPRSPAAQETVKPGVPPGLPAPKAIVSTPRETVAAYRRAMAVGLAGDPSGEPEAQK